MIGKYEKKRMYSLGTLTVDRSPSFFATADATFEKCFWVRQREKGAPFARPSKASLAHSTTIQENKKNHN